jgi:hypothetical protein
MSIVDTPQGAVNAHHDERLENDEHVYKWMVAQAESHMAAWRVRRAQQAAPHVEPPQDAPAVIDATAVIAAARAQMAARAPAAPAAVEAAAVFAAIAQAAPTLRPVVVPAYDSSDPEDVATERRVTRARLESMAGAVLRAVRFKSPDPVGEAACSNDGYNNPLIRYLFVRQMAGRDDLAAMFLDEAVADYKARKALLDKALPGVLPAELLEAAAAPAPARPAAPPRAAVHQPTPPAPARTGGTAPAAERKYKWCVIPQDEVTAWAISAKGADMLVAKFEADHARVKAEVPDGEFSARWRHLYETGAVVAFTREVYEIVSARALDFREGIKGKHRYQPPEHLKEQIDALRQDLWKQSKDRQRSGQSRQPADQTKKAKTPKTKKQDAKKPRLWQKTDQLREFREHAAEWGITGLTQLVWRELWDCEGLVAGRRWVGHTAVTQADLIERLGIGETKLKQSLKELETKFRLLEKVEDERKGVSAKVYRITFRPGYWNWIPDQDETPDGVSQVE